MCTQEQCRSIAENETLKCIDKYLQLQGRKLEDYPGMNFSIKNNS